jgi:hypothetical protein
VHSSCLSSHHGDGKWRAAVTRKKNGAVINYVSSVAVGGSSRFGLFFVDIILQFGSFASAESAMVVGLGLSMGLVGLVVTVIGRSGPAAAVAATTAGLVSVPPSQLWYVGLSRHSVGRKTRNER